MADINRNWTLYNVSKVYKYWQEYLFDWTMVDEYNTLLADVESAKSDMRVSIWNKWVTVPANAELNEYAWYIDQIQTVDDTLIGITWEITYWGTYSQWYYYDMYGIDWCVSYTFWDTVLIWYCWYYQDSNNYDYKDIHFLRRKKWQARTESLLQMWRQSSESFQTSWIAITRENNWESYLFTVKWRYIYSGYSWDYWHKWEIRYNVASDTFTVIWDTEVQATEDPWPNIVNDDMNLYTYSYEVTRQTRVALFTVNNS